MKLFAVLRDLFRKPCWDHRGFLASSYNIPEYAADPPKRLPWISRFVGHWNWHPWFGGDEWCRWTLVLPLGFAGLVIPLWACRDPGCETCREACPGSLDWAHAEPVSYKRQKKCAHTSSCTADDGTVSCNECGADLTRYEDGP